MKKKKLRVEKIGGTAMSNFGKIVENVILHDKNDIYNRVYVVSAYGGITNDLLEHKKTGRPGIYKNFKDYKNYKTALIKLKKRLYKINKGFSKIGLNIVEANQFIDKRIDSAINILNSMYNVLSSGYLNRNEILLAARELLASLGEMHSAFNSANILENQGYNAEFVDLSGWNDSRELTINERIANIFSLLDPSKTICFATGYAKGTEGIMREFDRGYSEVTFSKVAVLLKADEAVIHKEYHLCSGDPLIIGEKNIRPVCNTNFDVADQLADVGMEAIHPKASKPLEKNDIPIRVKNAFDPGHEGTLITKEYICPKSKIEIVTGSESVSCIEIHDARMVSEVGFDMEIMQVLAEYDVSYICKMTNANTISIVINDKDNKRSMLNKLEKQFEIVTINEVAIVCTIGSNIAKPGIMAQASTALAKKKINILAVSQTLRQTNMQFIIEREDFLKAQKALHHALCE
ncbi:MAG: aspartate kinase [Deltaproteobacteria bacterium]|nr:aspartate kinase [Deltaproteobacteria bacterium]